VATQVLEEGVDVPSCHLVIRFDLPATARGFIQSRGRARMPNSDYVLLVRRHVFQFCCYFSFQVQVLLNGSSSWNLNFLSTAFPISSVE
jgi:hypothetical protein